MSWSKVNYKHSKPLKWWYYKIMCEISWNINLMKSYYNHLDGLCKQGFNLYGEKI
jgi:hypothetical protein